MEQVTQKNPGPVLLCPESNFQNLTSIVMQNRMSNSLHVNNIHVRNWRDERNGDCSISHLYITTYNIPTCNYI